MTKSISAAAAILKSLKANGVDHVFVNSGTDFNAIIEAYAAEGASGAAPEPILAAHENAAVSMAHGHYLATGRAQAVMVHTNVGLANSVMGLINAHADDIPIIMFSGRTPLTEHDRMGARRSPIQYGQEQFDQTAMVRELVKWNYELRYGENAADLVSRACAIAGSEPPGAVYLSLPAEPLAELTPARDDWRPIQVPAAPSRPDPAAIEETAQSLAAADNQLIIVQRGDHGGRLSRAVSGLAERHAIAIAEVFVTRNVVASDHPMLVGPDLATYLPAADVVVVVDAGVAWIEHHGRPSPHAHVVHIGPDPLFGRMPVRSYRTTTAIAGNAAASIEALGQALDRLAPDTGTRAAAIRRRHDEFRAGMTEIGGAGAGGRITKAHIAGSVSDVLGADGIVFNERGAPASFYTLAGPNRFFGNTQAGGLGWCLPAALGAQMADRERLVVAVVGDGGYMFANPVVCHQIAEAHALPVLTIVANNGGWDAVRAEALAAYPDGAAARSTTVPLTDLGPMPDFCAVAGASRTWTRRVETYGDLKPALAEAVEVIRSERRQVMLDVSVAPEGPGESG